MLRRFREIAQLFSFRDIRNGLLALSVVFGGLGLALLTLFAHQTGNPQLAGFAATASLAFVLLIIIFVIPPLARSASAEASQLDLPFEFTGGGAVFSGLLVIVAFSAWNTGNNLLFLVLSFLASAMVTGFLFGHVCLKRLDVKMRFPDSIFAGEPTPILVSLHNRKRIFPTLSVTAEVRGKERERSALLGEIKKLLPSGIAERIASPPLKKHTLDHFVSIPKRGSTESRVEHVFARRGRFIIKDFELSTKFPFSFFRHRRRLSAQKAEIYIYPKLESLETEAVDIPLESGILSTAKRGSGQDLLALREYRPLDDLRHVDWKATARSASLTVRDFAAEDDRRVTVIIDPRMKVDKDDARSLRVRLEQEKGKGEMTESMKRFENAATKAASLLSHFAEVQAEIRLVIDDPTVEFGIGKPALDSFLKELSVLEPVYVEHFGRKELDANYAPIFNRSEESHIFFVTAAPDKELPGEVFRKAMLVRY